MSESEHLNNLFNDLTEYCERFLKMPRSSSQSGNVVFEIVEPKLTTDDCGWNQWMG